MKDTILIILTIMFLIVLVNFIFAFRITLTGQVVKERNYYYTYTQAICNETNYCEDFLIRCNNNEILSITPTGFAVQNPSNWVDSRNQSEIKKFCDR